MVCEEKTLQHIESVADAIRANTSPAGAEAVQEEAEELRLGWQRLRQGLCEAEDGLRGSLDAHSQYVARCRRLGDDIGRLRHLLQGLDRELVGGGQEARSSSDHSEEQIEGQWRKYTVSSAHMSETPPPHLHTGGTLEQKINSLKSEKRLLYCIYHHINLFI